MVVIAFVLSVVGLLAMVGVMLFLVYFFYKKPNPEDSLPDGIYRLKCVGRDKLTGSPNYEVEDVMRVVEGEKSEDRRMGGGKSVGGG